MKNLLKEFDAISLQEMQDIRLMNRVDTKFVADISLLPSFLARAREGYLVQVIDGESVLPYSTLYFDTPDYHFYREHHDGRLNRQKLRIRSYESSDLHFLEIKRKNNHGRTKKKRIAFTQGTRLQDAAYQEFLTKHLHLPVNDLSPALSNHFHRITLVNRKHTERLTLDFDLRFHNERNMQDYALPRLLIVEIKRDGLVPSGAIEILRQLRIKKSGFSKYCMGLCLTDSTLKQNKFKTKIRKIQKLWKN